MTIKSEFKIEDAPFPLTDVDKWILSQTDEEFKMHDWDDLKTIIDQNNLSVLKRKPSELRKYMQWTTDVKVKYGSMSNYILVNRLPAAWGQPPFTPESTVPFANTADYKILLNDWPYGMDEGIRHIVVWTRTPIPADNEKGDLLPESRKLLVEFVQKTFIDPLGPGGEDKILWFKNWVALQSVRALEHFHVLVRDVDDAMLHKWTGKTEVERGI